MINTRYDPHRRSVLLVGSGLLLTAVFPWRAQAAEIEIAMAGTPSGSQVWFQPRGLWVQPGQTVRWVNRDVANVHTITAYHPDNKKPLRIPKQALPWDSGYLMPNASFALTFDQVGVYDYFCIPHEQAGMVARIVVGRVDALEVPYQNTEALLPAAALATLPTVGEIMEKGLVS